MTYALGRVITKCVTKNTILFHSIEIDSREASRPTTLLIYALLTVLPSFMKPECSLSRSKELATGHCLSLVLSVGRYATIKLSSFNFSEYDIIHGGHIFFDIFLKAEKCC